MTSTWEQTNQLPEESKDWKDILLCFYIDMIFISGSDLNLLSHKMLKQLTDVQWLNAEEKPDRNPDVDQGPCQYSAVK